MSKYIDLRPDFIWIARCVMPNNWLRIHGIPMRRKWIKLDSLIGRQETIEIPEEGYKANDTY